MCALLLLNTFEQLFYTLRLTVLKFLTKVHDQSSGALVTKKRNSGAPTPKVLVVTFNK